MSANVVAVEDDLCLLHTLSTCVDDAPVTVRGLPMKVGVHGVVGDAGRRVYIWTDMPEDTSKLDADHHLSGNGDDADGDVVYVRRPSDYVALMSPGDMVDLLRSGQFWICM